MIINENQSAATAALMDRFNEIFLRHDPAALSSMIAENCVIEKITPGPSGDRCVGRAACVALWTEIATAPGTRFELEETFTMDERAITAGAFGAVRRLRGAASI